MPRAATLPRPPRPSRTSCPTPSSARSSSYAVRICRSAGCCRAVPRSSRSGSRSPRSRTPRSARDRRELCCSSAVCSSACVVPGRRSGPRERPVPERQGHVTLRPGAESTARRGDRARCRRRPPRRLVDRPGSGRWHVRDHPQPADGWDDRRRRRAVVHRRGAARDPGGDHRRTQRRPPRLEGHGHRARPAPVARVRRRPVVRPLSPRCQRGTSGRGQPGRRVALHRPRWSSRSCGTGCGRSTRSSGGPLRTCW